MSLLSNQASYAWQVIDTEAMGEFLVRGILKTIEEPESRQKLQDFLGPAAARVAKEVSEKGAETLKTEAIPAFVNAFEEKISPILVGMVQQTLDRTVGAAGSISLLVLGALFLGVGIYYGTSYFYEAMIKDLKTPRLEIEQEKPKWRKWIDKNIFKEIEKPKPTIESLIFPSEVKRVVSDYRLMLDYAQKNNSLLPNMLLYGPPGTGKTQIAKRIRNELGKNCIYVSGSAFAKYPDGQGIQVMDEVFRKAQDDGNTIIFVDEIDVLLGDRKAEQSEKNMQLIANFLSYTGSRSDRYALIGATNIVESIDPAVLTRFDEKLYVPLPGNLERRKILETYIKQYLLLPNDKMTIEQDLFNDAYLGDLVRRTEGWSGRELENLCINMKQRTGVTQDNMLTKAIVDFTLHRIKVGHEIKKAA